MTNVTYNFMSFDKNRDSKQVNNSVTLPQCSR